MKVSVKGEIFDIQGSPLLVTMQSTQVPVDKDKEGNVIIDADPDTFREYVKYLEGKDFHMDEEVAALFRYMGHANDMEYPADYWGIKLRDNWIRDNFYKDNLGNDPYYGLIRVPKKEGRSLPDVPRDVYIAGGAALWLAGYVDTYGDTDIFTIDKDTAISWFQRNNEYDVITQGEHVISAKGSGMQLIKRVYTSPSEIVHGFDLDCVGILWDGMHLWATARAIYAMEHMVNWFDPDRMSPSYVHRLCKYMKRGYDIKVPFIDSLTIDEDAMASGWASVKAMVDYSDKNRYYDTKKRDVPIPTPVDGVRTYRDMAQHIRTIDIYEDKCRIYYGSIWSMKHFDGSNIDGYVPYKVTHRGTTMAELRDNYVYMPEVTMPHDLPSILILATKYGAYLYCSNESDYEGKGVIHPAHEGWTTQDPMHQLSGTFNPQEIDLLTWLSSSPLVAK